MARASILGRRGTAPVVALLGLVFATAQARADFSLGRAANYSLLTVPGNSTLLLSNVQVDGNVGVGTGGQIRLMAPSSINGNLYLAGVSAQQLTASAGQLNGSLYQNQADVDGAVADAQAAAVAAAALAPTRTLSSVTGNTMIVGNGGLNVIQINGNINLSNASLTFAGTSADIFVVNVSGTMNLGGTGGIGPAGAVLDGHIVLNFTGSGTLTSHVGNFVDASILAPRMAANLDGSFGLLYAGGGGSLGLLSGAVVHGTPFVPAPGAAGALAIGVAVLGRRRRG